MNELLKTFQGEWDKELSELWAILPMDIKTYKSIVPKDYYFKLKSYIHSREKSLLKRIGEERDKDLSKWINENVGTSSKAIFIYMATGKVPRPFDAPFDAGDRRRCCILLQARPEWLTRLSEIEALNIEGTLNGEKVMPWNEQIPLILDDIKNILK